jgi:hypothetical protein
MSGTLQDVMYTGPPTSSSGSTASFHGPSPAILDSNHPSSNGSAILNVASGSKRKDIEDADDDDDDAEAKKRKQKFTRSRTACFQVCPPGEEVSIGGC